MELIQTKDYLLLIDEEAEIEEGKTFITKDNIIHSHYGYNYGDRVVVAYYPLTKEAKELNLALLPNTLKTQQLPKEFIPEYYTNGNMIVKNRNGVRELVGTYKY